MRRASRLALAWPVEAVELLRAGQSLTELPGVGPWIAGRIETLAEDPPEAPATPPIRDDFMTFAGALATLATDASWSRAWKGDLQMHTVYSDGKESIEDMARAGMDLGYEYVAVTDHSKGLRIAGGIDEEALAGQMREIDTLVFERAAEAGKAVEIDCYPDRLDLDVRLLRLARDAGVMVSIGTDAHNTAEMRFMPLGLAAALKAGVPKERILNFMPYDELRAWRAS